MLYLESLILHKFKSFKHAELLLSKGYTCILGPNGSGKSNIADAILFVFGEASLNRLRIDRAEGLAQLINWKSPGTKLAYVTLNFSGDEKFSITKMVRADGKTKYKVNGKKLTRKEVIDLLGKYNVRVDETTTIAQDEISRYTRLNPKERRELIDIAAGITEFEYKKDEAVKELDKVTQKVALEQGVLNERLGYLKELEKEKEAAEHYLQMGTKLKSLRFSILTTKKDETKTLFEKYAKEIAILDSKKNDSGYKLDELSKRTEQMNQENQHLNAELNKHSTSMSETSAKREAVNKELTRIEAEILNHKSQISDTERAVAEESAEKEQIESSIKANKATIEQLTKEQIGKQSVLAALEQELGDDDLGTVTETLNKAIDEDEAKLIDVSNYLSKLQADEAVSKSRKTDAMKRLDETKQTLDEKKAEMAKLSKSADAGRDALGKLGSNISKMEALENEANGQLGETDSKLLITKEQLMLAQPRENSTVARLTDRFKEKDGFYGKASKLCTYDSEYATAVEVSAGSRFEYYVVDNIDIANRIIKYLKENGLGRATFIPIDDLRVENDARKAGDSVPLIELVKCESKFSKVFDYVFNNTYLIREVDEAKKLGIGKHRYVTKEGELIEQSGIISGGAMRGRVSVSRLENEIATLNSTKAGLRERLEKLAKELATARKEHAKLELSIGSTESELSRADSEMNHGSKLLGELERELSSVNEGLQKIGRELSQSDKEKMEIVSRLTASKASLKEHISKTAKMSKSLKMTGKRNADIDKANSLRAELLDLKVRLAELQKENQLIEKRLELLTRSLKEREKLAKELSKSLGEKQIRKEVLDKSRVDIEYSIMHSNETNKKALTRISELGRSLEGLGRERGMLMAEISNLDRQINEIKIERGKAETKFNDISAELASFGAGIALTKGKVEEMESEANILESKLAELGNVNMKAPELYAERKKTVEEAQLKLNILENEKNAVMRMITEIESKKMQTFLDILNEVNKNFMKLYSYVMPGKATLALEDSKDPLNSGLKVQLNNGDIESLTAKSGGERSLVSLMLLFAIHACKPSSLYIFDEIDKSLDKENSKKLSLLIKQMSKDAQFVVVTHNDALILNADVAIGVTKVDNESKAVGLDLSKITSNNKQ